MSNFIGENKMALPVIPVAIGMGIAALFGAYKGGNAILDNKEANNINDSIESVINDFTKRLDESREMCEQVLEQLGLSKYEALTKNISKFIDVFSQIKNIDFNQQIAFDELNSIEFSQEILKEIKQDISLLTSSSLGVVGGAATGAMTAFGAYSGTMALASASTGTAISTLSGAAASNATLAWLGGGSLASGGFGMAGGVLMLNAMIAAPALAVAGWYIGNQAEKKLNDAKSNRELAFKFREDAKVAIKLTDGISEIAVRSIEIISTLRKYSRRGVKKLEKIIQESGLDYQNYDNKEKEIVFKNVKIIQLLKAIIDTAILDKEGNLLGDVDSNIKKFESNLNQLS